MAQLLTALLVAVVGVMGALGGALLGYRASRRQAVDQGRVDHAAGLLERRRDAYLACVEATEPLDRAIAKIELKARPPLPSGNEAPPEPSVIRDGLNDVEVASHEIYRARAKIGLLGPREDPDMDGLSSEIWFAVRGLVFFLEDVLHGKVPEDEYEIQVSRVVAEIERTRDEFNKGAQQVLETAPSQ